MTKPDHNHFKVVLFDLGNTLIYYDAPWPESLVDADLAMIDSLRASGLHFDEEKFEAEFEERLQDYYDERESEFIEHTTEYVLRNLLEEFGLRPSSEVIRRALDALYAVSQAHWLPEEDAVSTLETLKAQGYRLGLISNAGDVNDVETLVDKAQVRLYFDLILISAAVGRRKPHPQLFRLALEHFQVQPSEAVMVGDTLGADILGAKGVGIATIWITRRADTPGNRDHLDTIQPDAQIETLAELPDVLANWPA